MVSWPDSPPEDDLERAGWYVVETNPFLMPVNIYHAAMDPSEPDTYQYVGFAGWTMAMAGFALAMGVETGSVWAAVYYTGAAPIAAAVFISYVAVDLVIRLRSIDDPYGFESDRVDRAIAQSSSSQNHRHGDFSPRDPMWWDIRQY